MHAAQYNKQAIQCTITFGDEYITVPDDIVVDYWYCSVCCLPDILAIELSWYYMMVHVRIYQVHPYVGIDNTQQSTGGIFSVEKRMWWQLTMSVCNMVYKNTTINRGHLYPIIKFWEDRALERYLPHKLTQQTLGDGYIQNNEWCGCLQLALTGRICWGIT